jgi:chloramphenicol O-acetyltransferase
MHVTKAELAELLEHFEGYPLERQSSFKTVSLRFYPNNVVPSFHTDIPFDASIIHSNYKTYYKHPGSTFSAWICYNLINTMQSLEFSFLRYRYINENWYCFNKLPLFVSVKIDDPTVQQGYFFIEDVANMSWPEFSTRYASEVAERRRSRVSIEPPYPSWYNISHQITTMPFDFTGYTPSQKHNNSNAHAPWFVMSQRQITDERIHFTLSCTLSHASCLPSEFNHFLGKFNQNLLAVPESQKITHYFSKSL